MSTLVLKGKNYQETHELGFIKNILETNLQKDREKEKRDRN